MGKGVGYLGGGYGIYRYFARVEDIATVDI